MTETQSPTIPYERQSDPESDRMCGAASLSMVYRSFGRTVPQSEIWPKISKQNRFGSVASTTHLMAQDALNRGYAALAIQARHPLQVLQLCAANGIRAVLSHRLKDQASTGHYTVLVGLDSESVVLHDPLLGPSRRVSHAELLDLWRPRYPNAEITGEILIGITDKPGAVPPCRLCKTAIPPGVGCPNCHKPVPLQPAVLLGCVGVGCAARMWNYVCCPFCDFAWSFGVLPAGAPSGSESDWTLDHLFREVDKFRDYLLSLPAAANSADVRTQLDGIEDTKEKLRLAQSEKQAYDTMGQEQLTQAQQKAKQDEEALLAKKEEINRPPPSSDGNALGQSLLKGLGLLG
jgi:hypothetical protein